MGEILAYLQRWLQNFQGIIIHFVCYVFLDPRNKYCNYALLLGNRTMDTVNSFPPPGLSQQQKQKTTTELSSPPPPKKKHVYDRYLLRGQVHPRIPPPPQPSE